MVEKTNTVQSPIGNKAMRASEIVKGRVTFNPKFLDTWWENNKYLPEDIRGKVLTIDGIEENTIYDCTDIVGILVVKIFYNGKNYEIGILESGEYYLAVKRFAKYSGFPVFVVAEEDHMESEKEGCVCAEPEEELVPINFEWVKVCKHCAKEI